MAEAIGKAGQSIRQAGRSVYALLVATYENWRDDRAIRLGAGLAYYAVFAAVPLLTSAIAVAGVVFSESEIQAFLIDSIEAIVDDVPVEVREIVVELAASVNRSAQSGALAIISVALVVFAASLFFIALQDALNVIWKIPVRHGLGFTMRRRLLAFGVVLFVGVALIASLAVQAIALVVDEILGGNIGDFLGLNDLVVSLATWAVGIGAIAVLFRLLISQPLSWRHLLTAASAIALLIVIGTWAVGVYFGTFGSSSLSAVSGGAAILLSWLYYMAQVLIGGAELLKTMDERSRSEAAT